jgi:dTDP-4-amino-4,6-dideoxygalactose transaminase
MIPQNNPLANYLALREEIDVALQRALASGWFILGKETEAFEREFADFVGTRYAVGVANGTEAICLALKAFGIGSGDRVLTVSHTAVATVAAIEMCGAVPVFVDIDPATYTMDPSLLAESFTDNAKAVVPVHLYGRPADLRSLPVTLPSEVAGGIHVYHQYVLQCNDKPTRDDLKGFLGSNEVQCAIHYPVPVHLQPFYLERFGKCDSLPRTEHVCEKILSLPMFPELNAEDIDTICTLIHEFFGGSGQTDVT